MVRIETKLFIGKQNIPWGEVEEYLKRYIGHRIIIKEYQDEIIIPGGFPNEYSSSEYSQRLKGGLAKTKANAAQVIEELILNATNRRHMVNKDNRHSKDASKGWYRYDVFFQMKVQGENETKPRWNDYRGTLVVRINDNGLYAHDIVNIKKEARTPLGSK